MVSLIENWQAEAKDLKKALLEPQGEEVQRIFRPRIFQEKKEWDLAKKIEIYKYMLWISTDCRFSIGVY